MIYRPEIDGLRAIAVIPVILFHAGLTLFSGGYVGVDVFFVISGYLITSILIGELEQDNFSITRFYERRARRILPALFFVMLCCIPFAWKWMLPSELKDFSQSVVSVVFFASNILFWREEGYFAPAAEMKPLLHTWSLAVEEQYYVLFPIFLLLAWRFGRRSVFWSICAIAALSLAASEWSWRNAPSANFYLAPTRAWELLAGSICAFLLSGREPRASNALSLAGLGLIVFAIFYFDDSTPFPSVYALAPVLGTALIILFGGSGSWAARLLSTRSFVGIGLISYSAYLWHQPLFAFARIRSVLEPSPELMMALAALSLVLAYFSWRYVETPFRKGKVSIFSTRGSVFAVSGAVAAAFIAGGLAGHLSEGAPGRKTPIGITFQDALKTRGLGPNLGLHSDCEGDFTLSANCRTSPSPQAILWGDSYAMHLAGAIAASPTPLSFVQHTKSQCAPIVDIAVIGSLTPWRDCLSFNDKVLAFIQENESAKYVVISSPFSIVDDKTIYFRDGRSADLQQHQVSFRKVIETAELIKSYGKQLVVVSPTPRTGQNIGNCLVKAYTYGMSPQICNFSERYSNTVFEKQYRFLEELSSFVPVVWLDEFICSESVCRAVMDGELIYRDTGHISIEGARYLGRKFDFGGQIIRTAEQYVSRQSDPLVRR